jgi:hypothetical protein
VTVRVRQDARTWFETVWEYMSEAQREGVRWQANHEHLTLAGALLAHPTLAPPALRHLIPQVKP